jgi:3-methyladenine DNA glycosylase AlkD
VGVDVGEFVDGLDSALRAAGTVERAEHEARYLKSSLEHYGTTVPAIRAAAKAAVRQAPEVGHDELIDIVAVLWAAPVHERRMAAVELLVARAGVLGIGDAPVLERLLRQSGTWALVDPLAASVVGPLVERDDAWGPVLDRWATDDDVWVRRAALLALLVPLRRGEGDWDRFARYADAMVDETEFFIRKAIGWVLRDTARRRPDLVFDWLLPRAGRASGVTVREALKPLSPTQRQAIEAARR